MKNKFVKIDSVLSLPSEKTYSFTEWFCLDSTWQHLYNVGNEQSKAFRKWCQENTSNFTNGVCPDVTVDGCVLNDGWGSDICARHCGETGGEDTWVEKMEAALRGMPQDFILSDASKGASLHVVMTPYDTIIPDETSLKAFGPFENCVRSSIAVANVIGTAMTKSQLKARIRRIFGIYGISRESARRIKDIIDIDDIC